MHPHGSGRHVNKSSRVSGPHGGVTPSVTHMIIAIAGQKGGVGKTTAAISLATEWHDRGRRVLLVDADPQGSTRTWADVAAERGEGIPHVVSMGLNLHKQLPQIAADYDIVLIDCPPRLSKVQRAAIITSDLVLLPCGPSPVDVWALGATLELVEEARSFRPDLPAAILVTRKQPRTSLGKHIREPLNGHGLPVLRAELSLRVAYAEALLNGSGPSRYAARTAAAKEVAKLADELELFMEKERARVA